MCMHTWAYVCKYSVTGEVYMCFSCDDCNETSSLPVKVLIVKSEILFKII